MKKTFDAVEMKRRAAEQIYERIKGMTAEEELAYWQEGERELEEQQAALRHEQEVDSVNGATIPDLSAGEYLVVFEKAGHVWTAHTPDVPRISATGATQEEAAHELQAALASYFSELREKGRSIPKPVAEAGRLRVPA